MTPDRARPRAARRRGFTLIEMSVASFLLAFLGMILLLGWKTFGVPAVQVEARARVTLQANLAAEALARDLGGMLLRKEGKSGPADETKVERLYTFETQLAADDDHPYPLRLRFKRADQADNPALLTISYFIISDSHVLMRIEEESGDSTAVANHVTDLQVNWPSDIQFTVSYQRFEGTFTLHPGDSS